METSDASHARTVTQLHHHTSAYAHKVVSRQCHVTVEFGKARAQHAACIQLHPVKCKDEEYHQTKCPVAQEVAGQQTIHQAIPYNSTCPRANG